MAKQTQILQVTTKNLKKIEAGKRLAEYNCMKREERTQLAKAQSESKLTYYYRRWYRHLCHFYKL